LSSASDSEKKSPKKKRKGTRSCSETKREKKGRGACLTPEEAAKRATTYKNTREAKGRKKEGIERATSREMLINSFIKKPGSDRKNTRAMAIKPRKEKGAS